MDTTRHLHKIRQLIEAGHFPHALSLLKPLRRLQPDDPALIWEEARVLEGTGRLQDALAQSKAVLSHNATYAPAWLMRARLLAQLQPELADPETDIARALELDPAFADAHAALAILRYSAGESSLALAAIGHAIGLAPSRCDYLTLRATWHELAAWKPDLVGETIRLRDGTRLSRISLQAALADYRELCRRQPDNARHWLKCARLLELLDNQDAARQAHEAGWQRLPSDDPRRACIPGQSLQPRRISALSGPVLPLRAPLAAAQRLLRQVNLPPQDEEPSLQPLARPGRRFNDNGFFLLVQSPPAKNDEAAAWCNAWCSDDGLIFATDLLPVTAESGLLNRLLRRQTAPHALTELFSAFTNGHYVITSQADADEEREQRSHLLHAGIPPTLGLTTVVATHRDRVARYLALHREVRVRPVRDPGELQACLAALFTDPPTRPSAAAPLQEAVTMPPQLQAAM